MLSIWFRPKTAQSTCRCVSCLSTGARAVARRPVTSPPWRLQFKHLTTLFYSSIIATAAAADTEAKQQRREKWIVAISEAERSIQELKERSEASDYPYPDDVVKATSAGKQDGVEGAAEYAGVKPGDGIFTGDVSEVESTIGMAADVRRVDQLLPELDAELVRSRAQARETGGIRKKIPRVVDVQRLSPISMYASSARRARWRPSWTSKKVVTMELSIAKLTTRFLLHALGNSPEPTQNMGEEARLSLALDRAGLEQRLADISIRLQQTTRVNSDNPGNLESLDFPRFTPAVGDWHEANAALNSAIYHLLRALGEGRMNLPDWLSKISYNLLISHTPPDLKIYTLLITRLSRLGHHQLVEMVIDSFYESKIRSDEIVVCAIIAHYTRKGKYREFERYAKRLEGQYGGLMLAQKRVPTDGVGASRLVARNNGKVVQLIAFDAAIYEAMIRGCLAFQKLDMAMDFYDRMRQDRIEASIPLFNSFLIYFSRQKDWDRGFGVWQNIRAKLLGSIDSNFNAIDPAHERSAYFLILNHCKACGKFDEYESIREEALLRGLSLVWLHLPRPYTRGFKSEDDRLQKLKLDARRLKYRAELVTQNLRSWSIQLLASKIILWGLDVNSVRDLFLKHADRNAFGDWLEQRPWFCSASASLKHQTMRRYPLAPEKTDIEKTDVAYAAERTFRFVRREDAAASSTSRLSSLRMRIRSVRGHDGQVPSRQAAEQAQSATLCETSPPSPANSPHTATLLPSAHLGKLSTNSRLNIALPNSHEHGKSKKYYSKNTHAEHYQAPLVTSFG